MSSPVIPMPKLGATTSPNQLAIAALEKNSPMVNKNATITSIGNILFPNFCHPASVVTNGPSNRPTSITNINSVTIDIEPIANIDAKNTLICGAKGENTTTYNEIINATIAFILLTYAPLPNTFVFTSSA